jgi:uncharacterized protein YqeY
MDVVMTLTEQLENSLKEAMRAGDDLRKRTIRMVLSAIRLTEVEKGSKLDDAGVTSVIQREIKSRNESILDAQRAQRPDIETEARAEIAVLETFLPQQLSSEELEVIVRQVIAEVGATNQKEMGMVMKALMPRLQGRAAGDQASQMVKRLLQ